MEIERGDLMERLELAYYYGQEGEQFTFYRLPKALITDPRFKDISNNAKLLYGLMLDRMGLSVRSGWFDDQNRVYIKYAVKSIMQDLNISKVTAVGLLKELQGIGLIDMIQRNGLANIIYVKNFVSEDKAAKGTGDPLNRSENHTGPEDIPLESGEYSIQTGKESEPVQSETREDFPTGTGTEKRQEAVQNLNPNKNDINHIDSSDTNPINPSGEKDPMDEADAYMALIRKNLDYDVLMSDRTWLDRDLFEELYEIICDVVCVPRRSVRIAGEEYPYNLVRSKFLKLNCEHLKYVIDCMRKNTTKISNIKAYMITALYNAPSTISNYYQAEVNHDLYGTG